ncbi:MAG: diguanylate cyclase/phosphodiesterase with and domain [Ilumatobacteraceae bacterium]|nr:diguanylate cyclase/phosphodiesterase with and domain [Ilumatobacteraceae bacterium]
MGMRRAPNEAAGAATAQRATIDLDLVPVPLVELDINGIVTAWNSAASSLLGWRPDQAIGRRSLDILGREMLGPNVPAGRQRARLNHVDGTHRHADLVMTGDNRWGATVGRSIVAILQDAAPANGNAKSVCPTVEPWAAVSQQIQSIGGDVLCVGVGIVGVEAINKGYSRSTGDEVLAEILRRLLTFAGKDGHASRIGGNQFVLTVPGVETSLDLANVIRQLSAPVTCTLGSVRVGIACGIASGPSRSALVLLDRTSHATEQALASGLGSVKVSNSDNRGASLAHPRLDSCLIDAVAQSSIAAVYQPVVDMTTGDIIQLEALARWHSAEFGDVEPAVFIEAAEQTGLIHDLGDNVLGHALDVVREEHLSGRWVGRRMSINLSARQIEHPDVVERITTALALRQLSPTVLQIEVTEGSLLSNVRMATAHMAALKRMGVAIAIDDFGSGAANLSHLRDLPATVVKIDRRFVNGILTSSTDREIVRSIVFLAGHLGMTVVAVGVETPAQHHELRRLGCRYAQGFLYARPREINLLGIVDLPAVPAPFGDAARLERLHATRLLDTPADERFDAIVREAALLCGAAVAFLSLIDGERQWFKSAVGTSLAEVPLAQSPCLQTIRAGRFTEIPDTALDASYAGGRNPDGTYSIRSVASAPLRTKDGHVLGTLCVADPLPRELTAQQRQHLERLATNASLLLDLAIAENDLAALRVELDQARDKSANLERRTASLLDRAIDGLVVLDSEGRITLANSQAMTLLGATSGGTPSLFDMVDQIHRPHLASLLDEGSRSSSRGDIRVGTGGERQVTISAQPCTGTTDVMLTVRQVQHV